MRRSTDELRTFYGDPKGALVRRILARQLAEAWGTADNCDVLGIGYATPWLGGFSKARRLIAAMPGQQGAEQWCESSRNRTVLVNDTRLPFATGMFDRILMVHALEEADDPQGLLNEASRVLSPSGRLIVVCAARGGLWSRSEATPFGHGRPFSRRQMEGLIRSSGLEPRAWSQAVFVPPWRPALPLSEGFEQFGRLLAPGAAGLILMEAGRRIYAIPRAKGGIGVRAGVPVLNPVPSLTPAPRIPALVDALPSDLAETAKPLYVGQPCTD